MAIYPSATSVSSDMLVAANNASTTLNGAIANGTDSTITVISTSLFGTSGTISIDLEIIKYTSKNSTQFLSCTRGYDGTTGVAHNDGTLVLGNDTAAYHNVLAGEVIAIETELGITPKGGSASVAARLSSLGTNLLEGLLAFTGPLSTIKTFTLPNASATILTSNTAVTVAQGGTNATTASITSFNNITGYSAAGATGTTSTSLVFSTSPALTTPTFVTSLISSGSSVIGTDVTSGHTLKLQGYNGSAYVDLLTVTNAATPTLGVASLAASGTIGTAATTAFTGATGIYSTSVSTPSLITASGAMAITPAAGSNLNVALSTTGDFAVNTNQLYVDTSTGNVGIGTASPSVNFQVAQRTANSTTSTSIVGISTGNTYGSTANKKILDLNFMGGSGSADLIGARIRSWDESADIDGALLTFWTSTAMGTPLERMRIDRSGNVGIGTTAPVSNANQTSLTINGTNYSRLDFMKGGTAQADIYSNDTGMVIEKLGLNSITLQTNGLPRVFVQSDGNVGIGTTGPTGKFQIGNTIDTAPLTYTNGVPDGFVINATRDTSGAAFPYAQTTDFVAGRGSNTTAGGSTMRFFVQPRTTGDPTQAMTLRYDGNVGIGTASPGALLDVQSNTTADKLSLITFTAGATGANVRLKHARGTQASPTAVTTNDDLGQFIFQGYDGSSYLNGAQILSGVDSAVSAGVMPGYLSFFTNQGFERMRITSTGNVGIGTASPGAVLQVGSTAGSTSVIGLIVDGPSSWAASMAEFRLNGTPKFKITQTGGLVATGLAAAGTGTALVIDGSGNIIPLTSSERTKTNITHGWMPSESDIHKFLALSSITFAYKSDPNNLTAGFSAEEMAESGLPYLVNYVDGKPYSLRDQSILAYQGSVIKYLASEIDSLKSELASLRRVQ